jgi:hypothetical protein
VPPILDHLKQHGPSGPSQIRRIEALLTDARKAGEASTVRRACHNHVGRSAGLQGNQGRPASHCHYDIYSLLKRPEVQKFIGTEAYKAHKQARFRQGDNQNMAENEAFILSDAKTRARYTKAYDDRSALYFSDKLTFDWILAEIGKWTSRL